MKKMRVRRWLKLQKQSEIYLGYNDILRIGNQNIEKLTKLSRRYSKQVHINVQPKIEIYDEAYLLSLGKEVTRTNLNEPNVIVSQSLEGGIGKWIN